MQQRMPTWVQMMAAKVMVGCPAGCLTTHVVASYPEAWNMHIVMPLTAPNKEKGFGRCLRCMTYWEFNHRGEFVALKWGPDVAEWAKEKWKAKNDLKGQ